MILTNMHRAIAVVVIAVASAGCLHQVDFGIGIENRTSEPVDIRVRVIDGQGQTRFESNTSLAAGEVGSGGRVVVPEGSYSLNATTNTGLARQSSISLTSANSGWSIRIRADGMDFRYFGSEF